ncbi:hypothetical protein H0H87_010246 [Tephrocybe sp. NHM501043]|nr:hypothetical protein H0H87_010246 [Tephrocybe sp. NHM501043]
MGPQRTASPSIHWIVPILAGVPFGAGVAQILQSLTTYLMDTYPLYFASSIAATIVLRSCCGAAFPLFSPAMFAALGDEWAMSKYGSWIRSKSRVACKDSFEQPTPSILTPSTHLVTIQEKVEEKDSPT